MSRITDEDLMQQVGRGDLSAFEELLARWEGPAKRYAYRMLGDYQVAEDVAQEAFVRLHRSAARYRPSARFSTFFYTVLGNLCRDRIRKIRRRPQEAAMRGLAELEQEPADRGGGIPGPVRAVLDAEQREIVAEAVRSLPTHLMQAVSLREFEGLKYREIAETLDCDLNEVKVLIHRGRKALAKRLRRVMQPDRKRGES
ncbi:MAG: RNA polymerase sigma factor [Planctomycetota bacterium]|jgi:RNA polymerase sigma-70 factor (ECF subfamily)